jgi:hypothetical protein
MKTPRFRRTFLALLASAACAPCLWAQSNSAAAPAPATTTPSNTILLTVFMRHDQSKTLDEINAHLEKTGFRKNFPPEGVEIISYHIVMGIGQVMTLRVPPDKLRAVNVAFEKGAWGAYRTEFYATYDFLPIFREQKEKEKAAGK